MKKIKEIINKYILYTLIVFTNYKNGYYNNSNFISGYLQLLNESSWVNSWIKLNKLKSKLIRISFIILLTDWTNSLNLKVLITYNIIYPQLSSYIYLIVLFN